MTRPEFSNTRDLTMSHWIRENLPDSSTGFLVSDLDFIMENYKTKNLMLLEVKTRNADLKEWQRRLFENLDRWLKKGIDEDWTYLGFHTLKFENTCFADGKCFFDNKQITEEKLKELLSAFI